MTWEEYVEKAKVTITHDSNEKLLFCTMAGLMGELTEYLESGELGGMYDVSELSDIMWYIAVLSDHLGIKLGICKNTDGMEELTLNNSGYQCIGVIQETLKKVVRDDNWVLSDPVKTRNLELHFDCLFTLLIKECVIRGWDFSEVLTLNIEKLYSRKERNVLKGSGNDR